MGAIGRRMAALGIICGIGLAGRAVPGAAQPAAGGGSLRQCHETGKVGLASWGATIKPGQPISIFAYQSQDVPINSNESLTINFRCDVSASGVRARITILKGQVLGLRNVDPDAPVDDIREVVARSARGDVARYSIETGSAPDGVRTLHPRPNGDLEHSIINGKPVELRISLSKGGNLPAFTLRFADIEPALAHAVGASQEIDRQYQAGQCAPKDPDCFLTTAAVTHVGLNDDCWELRVLRGFRDRQLTQMSGGPAMIAEYHVIAPTIVAGVSDRIDSRVQWIRCYITGIVPCAVIAHLGMNRMAVFLYRRMVQRMLRLAATG